MALAYEGFSIREYASKMRAVDVVKCCPFDITSSDDTNDVDKVESLLPPITVTKFRWWAHELERVQSDPVTPSGLSGERFGVSEGFEGDKNNSESDIEREESMQIVGSNKVKSRSPKKRSIVEIFAVAPQIEGVGGGDEVEDDGDEEDRGKVEDGGFCSRNNVHSSLSIKRKIKKTDKTLKKTKKKKKKLGENSEEPVGRKVGKTKMSKNGDKKKKNIKKKKMMMMMMIKKKQKMIVSEDEPSVENKESICKLKEKIPSDLARNSISSCGETHRDVIFDVANIHREKPILKAPYTKKKPKVIQRSKVAAKHQRQLCPVRGILKKQTKVLSGENSPLFNIKSSIGESGITSQPEKHVHFLVEDDASIQENLEASGQQSRRHAKPTDTFELTGTRKDITPVVIIRDDDDDVSVNKQSLSGAQAVTEMGKLPSSCDQICMASNMGLKTHGQGDIKDLSKETPCHNQHLRHFGESFSIFEKGKSIASCNPPYVENSRFFPLSNGRHDACSNIQIAGCVSRHNSSSSELSNRFCCPSLAVCGTTSRAGAVDFLTPSSSCLPFNQSDNPRIFFQSAPSVGESTGNALSYPQSCPLHPISLLGASADLPEWKRRTFSLSDKCTHGGYLGLPLNSQGELIQFNPSGNVLLNQLKSDTLVGPSCVCSNNFFQPWNKEEMHLLQEHRILERARANDQLDLFPMHMVGNSNLLIPSRLEAAELLGTKRADVIWQNLGSQNNSFSLLKADTNPMTPCSMCTYCDKVQHRKGVIYQNERDHMPLNKTPVTMRLMGKDVSVGRSSKEMQFEDGHIWKDKEIIIEQRPVSTDRGSCSMNGCFLQDWTIHEASGVSRESLNGSFGRQNNAQLRLPLSVPQSQFSKNPFWQTDGLQNVQVSVRGNHNPRVQSLPHSLEGFSLTCFHDPFMTESETLGTNTHSGLPSFTQDTVKFGQWGLDSTYVQNLPDPKKSAFQFPFLHPDCGQCIQPPLAQRSSENPSPWMSHASFQQTYPTDSQTFLDFGGRYHPCAAPVSQLFTSTPAYHPSGSCVSQNPTCVHLHSKSPLGVSVQPPIVPVLPVNKPAGNIIYDSAYNGRDRTETKCRSLGPENCKKTKKRPASRANQTGKPNKLPNIEVQKQLITDMPLMGESPSIETGCGTVALLGSNMENHRSIGCLPNGFQNNLVKSSSSCESFRVSGVTGVGPTKLSAGAKHILKPTVDIDQDNSRPTHSTIPFAGVGSFVRAAESQMKPTNV